MQRLVDDTIHRTLNQRVAGSVSARLTRHEETFGCARRSRNVSLRCSANLEETRLWAAYAVRTIQRLSLRSSALQLDIAQEKVCLRVASDGQVYVGFARKQR